ncbi:hypothetical protein FHS27_003485 [Rhodopirellula rubra]|uniref:Hydantoinase A/oxoprolinase domain-containing protein n=1 Tax=Aporhodopirellula rubra TaxID=980271 RepID=A0A7W5E045_9BACT|nr:hydantoinase/oxoprolinase family protein [Aporhodopirellula rubra]MBB3207660.1 hypothetical protein [Aporhodopirellula rubra]
MTTSNTASPSRILGIDIGGANLKYATEDGRSFERSFPMWTRHEELGRQLTEDIQRFGDVRALAVTMTGELADCFAGRADGVRRIVAQVTDCLPRVGLSTAGFYGTDGRFYNADSATENWENIAASNWHALAKSVGLRLIKDALLIDVGSTTTDVIAIRDGDVLTHAATDYERLREDCLVYVGCRRTPVCALVSELRFRDESVPVMNEVFATIDDARLILGRQSEDSRDHETADSHPRDRRHAKARLARMIGLDRDQMTDQEVSDLSKQILAAAETRIETAVTKWITILQTSTQQSPTIVLSGHGQDLVRVPDDARVLDLREELSGSVSRGAPAWAVAVLAGEDAFMNAACETVKDAER